MSRIDNVLASRYAGEAVRAIWSPEGRIVLEREFWIAVMKAQRQLGLDIPEEAIQSYEKVKNHVNPESIREREAVSRHDVKARIEEFCALAGYEHIHKGMTSRDLTENVEQLQIYRSLQIIRNKTAAALVKLAARAEEFADLVMTARTHNVAAQPTTFGKRLAMFGEELLLAFRNLEALIETYPVRGLKGAVGTQLDQLTLFEGDEQKVLGLENAVIEFLGIPGGLSNVGQVYPRSLDFQVISALYQLGAAPSGFAKTLRLMAGYETASEGFAKGQVGSSAMPHKMNSRSCERINGFQVILSGYLHMVTSLSGDQWNEGDVSCSVVRRVALPDSFFAMDGLLETFLTILNQLEPYPAVIERENRHYFPFLATTTILMKAVRNGAGRETAHEAIKEHAVAVVREMRSGDLDRNDLARRLASDFRIGLTIKDIEEIIADAESLVGTAKRQIVRFAEQAAEIATRYPDAAAYSPGEIL